MKKKINVIVIGHIHFLPTPQKRLKTYHVNLLTLYDNRLIFLVNLMFWMNLFTLLLQLKKIFFYIFGLLVGVNKHFI